MYVNKSTKMTLRCLKKVWQSSLPIIFHTPIKRSVHVTVACCKKNFTRPSGKFSKARRSDEVCGDEEDSDVGSDAVSLSLDEEYNKLADRTFRVPDMGHNVFVIQPYVKWGVNKKRNTTPDLQLAESCALINTLNRWSVVDQTTISLMSLEKTTLFGKGNLEKLQQKVSDNMNISAVFISIDILKGVQRQFLEDLFKVPVYDRYSIVIQIFREHAISREAKLQLKLAELPYMRGRIRHLQPQHHFTGSSGETFVEFQRNLLKEQERKIKAEVENLRSQRDLLRKKRQKSQLPIVAVVGYTNSGKTSLIKALTEEDTIMPKNVLFATLDVTVHAGLLPSRMKALYVDTIGFISDIPTTLLESFVATLEDALLADIIVHVIDVSHPDAKAQMDHVHETLRGLNLSEELMKNIIEVGNKVDLVDNIDEAQWPGAILTSTIKFRGIDEVKEAVEEAIIRSTGRRRLDVRVRTGGSEYQWLMREATVCSVRADPDDAQYCFMLIIIAPNILAKFTHQFITSAD